MHALGAPAELARRLVEYELDAKRVLGLAGEEGGTGAFGLSLLNRSVHVALPVGQLVVGVVDDLHLELVLLAIAVLGTIIFISSWNEFMMSFIMLPNKEAFTIPLMFQSQFNDIGSPAGQCELMLAACLSMLPIVLICMMIIVNKVEIMENYTNNRLQNIIGWSTSIILITLSAILIISGLL